MNESEATLDLSAEKPVADVAAAEEKETTACLSSTDDAVTEPDKHDVEPPSELEQKIIKQVEVSNFDLMMSLMCVLLCELDHVTVMILKYFVNN